MRVEHHKIDRYVYIYMANSEEWGDIRLKYSTVDHPDNQVSASHHTERMSVVAAPAREQVAEKVLFLSKKGASHRLSFVQ